MDTDAPSLEGINPPFARKARPGSGSPSGSASASASSSRRGSANAVPRSTRQGNGWNDGIESGGRQAEVSPTFANDVFGSLGPDAAASDRSGRPSTLSPSGVSRRQSSLSLAPSASPRSASISSESLRPVPTGEALLSPPEPQVGLTPSTSLRAIRRNVESKTAQRSPRLSVAIPTSSSPTAGPSHNSEIRPPTSAPLARPDSARLPLNLTPRAAGGGGLARSASTSVRGPSDATTEMLYDDEGAEPRSRLEGTPSRAQRGRLSMMDFLASERDQTTRRQGLEAPSSRNTAASSVHGGSPAAAASSFDLPPNSDSNETPQRRPVSMMAASPTTVGEGSSEAGMAPLSAMIAEPTTTSRPVDGQTDASYSAISSQMQRSLQRSLHPSEQEVGITVKPSTDTLTMFGSTQTSANYSLSGRVIITLPRPHRQTGEEQTSNASASVPFTLTSLAVVFSGFSTYADMSGRYSGIKLCEISQELLTDGATLPLAADLAVAGDAEEDSEPLSYEIQFDINVPGWLPASVSSRFGATFYCVGAKAIALDGSSKRAVQLASSADGVDEQGSSERVEEMTAEPENYSPTEALQIPQDRTGHRRRSGQRSSTRSSSINPIIDPFIPLDDGGSSSRRYNEFGVPVGDSGRSTSATVKAKTKESWLSKRAKQLSLKPRSASDQSDPQSASSYVAQLQQQQEAASSSQQPIQQSSITRSQTMRAQPHRRASLRSKLDGGGKRRLRDGSLAYKSDKRLVIIRRCRDLVPVPVARLAIVGDNVPGASQDAATALQQQPQPQTLQSAAERSTSVGEDERHVAQSGVAPLPPSAPAPAPAPSGAGPSPTPSAVPDNARVSNEHANMARVDIPAAIPSSAGYPPTEVPERLSSQPLPLPAATSTTPFEPPKSGSSSRRIPSAPARTSSAMGTGPTDIPPTSAPTMLTSNGEDGAPPMRHFLHRPILHPPTDSGIEESDGLPFSLTISVPSHVQVQNADMLNFAVQIEVGRSLGWSKVRELGGLRLREMELVCSQSERHTSVASRTFCATFPLPPEPHVKPYRLPLLPDFTPPMHNRPMQSSQEVRVRSGYDREPIASHLAMADVGRVLAPEENDVERIRSNIVGPPPNFQKDKQDSGDDRPPNAGGSSSEDQRKGKSKEKDKKKPRGSSIVPPPTTEEASSSSQQQPPGATSSVRPIPPSVSIPDAMSPQPMSATSPTESRSPSSATPRRGGRGRRAYEATVRGLSAFATAVMDVGYDDSPNGSNGAQQPSQGDPMLEGDQPRASYNFTGEDGHGVDLTKGRIRMTVNLPLVSSSASAARRDGTPQLMSDYESPHMRVRHKLKVKLGFGFGAKPLGGEGEWGQALVMCVPVRFTEAPPREVREQFAPMPVTVTSAGAASQVTTLQPTISIADPNCAPLLPAYTQLFRDDGSRLNEAEDLPAYPGPQGPAVPTAISSDATTTTTTPAATPGIATARSRPSFLQRPSLPHRGSVTGPMTPRFSSLETSNPMDSLSESAAAAAAAAGGGDSAIADASNAAALPAMNSLAPESIVDEAIRGITDPDESMAAMREQEREMREMEDEANVEEDEEVAARRRALIAENDGEDDGTDEDRDGTGGGTGVSKSGGAAVREDGVEVDGRYAVPTTSVAGGELPPTTSSMAIRPQLDTADTFVSVQEDFDEHAEHPSTSYAQDASTRSMGSRAGEEVVVVGGEGADRVQAVEEELGS